MQSDHATRPIAAFNFDGPPETRSFWVGSLPHWEVLGRPIFVTLHVRGAIPFRAAARIRKLAAEIKDAKESEYDPRLQMIFKEMERWLDRTDRVSLLVQDAVADTLRDAIEKRTASGAWTVLHWVIMPSHLHLLYLPGACDMKSLMTDFKRWTGHQAAKILGTKGRRFWQEEWFDHWCRSIDETERVVSYIQQNPVKAGLVQRAEDWPYGCWHKSGM